eukprot:7799762-Alexandrium_andersonii.AAC.1
MPPCSSQPDRGASFSNTDTSTGALWKRRTGHHPAAAVAGNRLPWGARTACVGRMPRQTHADQYHH